ncbi:MAG: EAL domain-containing protein [Leptolyngbyaceae cyanobacterium SM2_5_2]|nr:EAL domain-containing protein [Leptolyngbyaceae cyanobacterium SM2_5_2]
MPNSNSAYSNEVSLPISEYPLRQLEDISLLICHELRTPLTSIQGALKLLEHQQFGCLSDHGQRLLAIAINNAERLNRLANALENQPAPLLTLLSPSEIELLQLENDLFKGFESQEFYLVYQPIISINKNQIIGFEALARWRHGSQGLIAPDIFIPLAEKTGLIRSLGLWLLDQACRQLHQWQVNFPSIAPLSVSVNLSTIQLLQPQLVNQIDQIIQQNHIIPSNLKLEITESALIENQSLALEVLIELRELGIQLYVDDFGIGYSSLGRLQDLPFDTLKIDRSFIKNKNWAMSEAIMMLANRLDLDVIVEGVETFDDLVSLQQLGCDKMQGYYFSKPTDNATVLAMLEQQQLDSTTNLINGFE